MHGTITYSQRAMVLHLNGSKQANSPTQISGDAQIRPDQDSAFDAETAAGQAGCRNGHSPFMAVWIEPDPTVNGVSFDPPSSGIDELDTRWSVDAPGIAFPLDKIRTGAGFSFATGPRSLPAQSCGANCSESFEGQITWVFTRR